MDDSGPFPQYYWLNVSNSPTAMILHRYVSLQDLILFAAALGINIKVANT